MKLEDQPFLQKLNWDILGPAGIVVSCIGLVGFLVAGIAFGALLTGTISSKFWTNELVLFISSAATAAMGNFIWQLSRMMRRRNKAAS